MGCAAILCGLLLGASGEAPILDQAHGKRDMYVIEAGAFVASDAPRHQAWLQEALDRATKHTRVIVIAPGEYVLVDAKGLRVPGNVEVRMAGARFVFAEDQDADGQAFLVEDASNVSFYGGEIFGRRDVWDPGVNIAGIRVRGRVEELRVCGTHFENLTSNGIGVFGSEAMPIRNVTVTDVTVVNCCNFYGDYLEHNAGPAKGSAREDQGSVAFYLVDGWRVAGCRFEGSQSDGTHFYRCKNGVFIDSVVSGSQMGGYFLEGCEHVLASNNLITGNGSRGVTIERDSRFCTLQNNLIAFSGREGLWAPDVEAILVQSNLFRENGRKDDGEKHCEIRLDDSDKYKTRCAGIRIQGNIFFTSAHQTATVYLADGVEPPDITDNTYHGPAPRLRAPG